ncbi:MAG: c-type cytochrome [Pseudomonadota bacterium]
MAEKRSSWWLKPRTLLTGVVIILAVVTAVFGERLLDLWRLSEGFAQLEKEKAMHPLGVYELVDACVTCHGFEGNSRSPLYPSLSGLPEAYILSQLRAFADGQRKSPIMAPLAMSLSEREMDLLAEFYSGSPVEDPKRLCEQRPEMDADTAALLASCTACHGGELKGGAPHQPDTPRIAGQGQLYLANQLRHFKTGHRGDPSAIMAGIANTLTEQAINTLALEIACMQP